MFCLSALLALFTAGASHAAISNVGLYHLGESGSVGGVGNSYLALTNAGAGGAALNITSYQNAGSTVSLVTTGLAAPGSTAALSVAQTAPSGYYGGGAYPTNNNFAFEVWANPAAGMASGNHDIFSMANNAGTVKLSLNGGNWCGVINGVTFATGAAAAVNTWTPVAIIRSNGVATLYVNGVAQPGTSSVAPVVGAPMLFFGPGGLNGFTGVLDEARVFTFDPATDNPAAALSVLAAQPPAFAVNLPARVSVLAGGTLALMPVVTGLPPLAYQWQSNGIPMLGATNASLTLPKISAVANGSVFNVAVSNAAGAATSASAVLDVETLTTPSFPGPTPGVAQSAGGNGGFTLSNNLISMSWTLTNGSLVPATFVNQLAGQTWPQAGAEIFRLGHGALGNARRFGIRIGPDTVDALVSYDGYTWVTLTNYARSSFPGDPAFVQLGKMDLNGTNTDYSTPGAMGESHLSNFLVTDTNGATLLQDNFSSLSPAWTILQSAQPGTAVFASNNWLVVDADANCAAYARQPLPAGAGFASCTIDKFTDAGQSWAPSLCLRWANGAFLLVGYRAVGGTFNVISSAFGESILTPPAVAGLNVAASGCALISGPQLSASAPDPQSARVGDQLPGQELAATFQDTNSGLTVGWRAVLRDGANYIRQFLTISSTNSSDQLNAVQLLDFATGNSVPAQIGTTTSGNPVVAGQTFFGGETPFANNARTTNHVSFSVPVALPLGPGAGYDFSSVVGVFPAGQMRRGFLYYLERERAMAYRPLLHYNTWLDLGRGQSEAAMLNIINTTEAQTAQRLGTGLDSYAIDDGWDNSSDGFWAIDPNEYPDGFTNLTADVAADGTHLGIWISPLGGYAPTQAGRIAAAQAAGLIAPGSSALDLSYPPYYNWWTNELAGFITGDQMNYFKWDNAGSGVTPHFMALLRSADYLRALEPDLFINVTVGTWPSPFWLSHVDSTWRGGGDLGAQGPGDTSERWITYRDAVTYQNIVVPGPLYPLNSIMVHGLVAATNSAIGGNPEPADIFNAQPDLRHQVRSFFGAGANLQELYLSPSALTSNQWNQICAAAAWARAHVNILADTHWIGGNPGQTNVYGWAAWTPSGATLTLRNPSAQTNAITLDAQTIFELPSGAATNYLVTAAYADQRPTLTNLIAGQPVTLTLQPFEVLVFDATPAGPPQPPAITRPPVPQTAPTGGGALFSCAANGTPPLAYQWRFNNAAIPGATNATLALAGLDFADAGNYSVTVTNAVGATNASASLTVLAAGGGSVQWTGGGAGGALLLSWAATGALQQAPAVTGPWSDAPDQSSPQAVVPTNAAMFFRVRR